MATTTSGTLTRWGNSQGVRIPKDICDLLGVQPGAQVDFRVDESKSEVTLVFARPNQRYRRNRKVLLEELCKEWLGEKAGEEWSGCDIGAEVVE